MRTNNVFEKVKSFDEIKCIIERIAEERSSYDFLIDGVVVKVNDFAMREKNWAILINFQNGR